MNLGQQSPPCIVIVGRPNVGKSTLFNRLLGRRRALVHDMPGVTRDRMEEKATWWVRGNSYLVRLVDTGGLGGDHFSEEIATQVKIALSEAHAVLLLFDAQSGLTPADQDIVRQLKKSGIDKKCPLIGVVNKIDVEVHEHLVSDFYSTGIDPILTISSEHGRGIDDLQSAVLGAMGAQKTAPETGIEIPRVAVVGRPNVGKSSLVNALLGKQRMITSPIAGTTIDAIDSFASISDKPFILIDTAGIRRKSKTEKGVEVLSVVQTKKALERANIAVLLIDAQVGPTDQDEKIGGLIEEMGCAVVLLVNKWDTQKQNPKFTQEVAAERIRREMAYLKYAPLAFISAKRKEGLDNLGDLFEEILQQRRLNISTHELTTFIRAESEVHNPKNAKFYLCHSSGKNPPTFVCHVSDPKKVHFSLKRHLINAIRERWGYMGNPIRILFIQGKGRSSTK